VCVVATCVCVYVFPMQYMHRLQVTHSAAGDDCTNTCALAGLRCEDAFFPWVAHFTMHYAGKLFSSPCDQGYIIEYVAMLGVHACYGF
jgi:hypothetical protein